MKILMVLTSTFPPDPRVEKEARSLAGKGHDVHIVCYADGVRPNSEKTGYCTVHRLGFSNFFRNKWSALALIAPVFFHRWQRAIKKLHSQYQFDALHIHDLPLSKVGYYFKKNYNCRLICDQHEFYSNWIVETAHMNTLPGRIILKFSDWEKYEKKYLNLTDLVITVAKPLELNYIEKQGIANIITVPNTPTKRIFNPQNITRPIVEKYKNDFVVFYAGGIDILRGIDTAIVALKAIKKEVPNVKLVMGGIIRKPYNPVKTAKKHRVSNSFEFVGWIDEELLPSFIAASDVCFFTPPATRDEINKTIATKIYQYAIMKKPVIVSEAKMMKEFVEENNLGIAIESGNSRQFSEAVLKIYNNEFFLKPNNPPANWYWENTVGELILGYEELKII